MSRSSPQVWGKQPLDVHPMRDGKVEITLPSTKDARGLAESIQDVLSHLDNPSDPLLSRVFQTTYEHDPALEEAYRAKTRERGMSKKRSDGAAAIAVFQEGRSRFFTYRVRVDRDRAEALLRAVNDMRLILGSRVDIQPGQLQASGPNEPMSPYMRNLRYLTQLQFRLLQAMQAA